MGRRARRRAAGEGSPARAERSSEAEAPPAGRPESAQARSPERAGPTDRASRTEAKNAAARARLEPLADGERPRAVTIAAFVVAVVAVANVGSYVAGVQLTGGGRPPLVPLLIFTALLLVAVWGLWRARYWAVLGTQALLVLWILVWSLLLIKAENAIGVVISVAIILGAGALFWFLIRALARIQMPSR